jgi:hypothetical protein
LAQFQCGLWLLFERYNIAKHDQNKLEGEEEEERLCCIQSKINTLEGQTVEEAASDWGASHPGQSRPSLNPSSDGHQSGNASTKPLLSHQSSS